MITDFTPLLVTGIAIIYTVGVYCAGYNSGHRRGWTARVDATLNADTCRLCGGSLSVTNHGDVCPGHFVHHTLGDHHG